MKPEGDMFLTNDTDIFMPTFPSGERVKAHELGTWLQMIEDDDTIDDDSKTVARYIVQQLRAQNN